MFKFYRDANGPEQRREERLIGHDRFCQQKVTVPRYRRRRTTKRKQSEIEAAFELTSITTAINTLNSTSDATSLSSTSKGISPLSPPLSQSQSTTLPNNVTTQPVLPDKELTLLSPLADRPNQHQLHVHPKTGIVVWEGNGSEGGSVCSLGGFLSSIGGMLGCANVRKTSLKYEPSLCSGEMGGLSGVPLTLDPLTSSLAQGSLRLERATAHRICLQYLESRSGRYVLIDHLPTIGWRGNRLWYLLNDSTVGAERLLSITPLSPRSQPHPLNVLLKACQALQHPYVCPILDLDVLEVENLGQEFGVAVAPVVVRGSVRDVFQRSDWTESWERKWKKGGRGLSEVQVQRLSCQVLEALLELKSKGLPPGLGVHLHPGNILVQYGTARFSGLDNILFGHQPMRKSFFKYHSKTLEATAEEIDAVAFAHLVFSMCSGYEANSSQLTLENWTHVKGHPQASEVLEFVLRNPEGRIPTLPEIGQLDFYRTLDLRELRAPPPSTTLISGPQISVSAINFLVEYLKENHSQKLKRSKAKSVSGILTQMERNEIMEALWKKSSPTLNLARRTYSSSTPSIPQAVENENLDVLKQIMSPVDLNSNSNTSSVYWTPPNSLS